MRLCPPYSELSLFKTIFNEPDKFKPILYSVKLLVGWKLNTNNKPALSNAIILSSSCFKLTYPYNIKNLILE